MGQVEKHEETNGLRRVDTVIRERDVRERLTHGPGIKYGRRGGGGGSQV